MRFDNGADCGIIQVSRSGWQFFCLATDTIDRLRAIAPCSQDESSATDLDNRLQVNAGQLLCPKGAG